MAYKKRDKSKAICRGCEAVVSTTFKARARGKGKNRPKALVAVCDQCDAVVAIPQQSFGPNQGDR